MEDVDTGHSSNDVVPQAALAEVVLVVALHQVMKHVWAVRFYGPQAASER